MVGTMIAYRLAEAGVRVTLVESAFAGSGSTGAAMGHIVVMDDSPEQLALCAHSRARWDELAATLPPSGEHEHAGTLWLATSDAELAGATARVAGYQRAGIDACVVNDVELYRLEPSVRRGLAGALRVPGDAVCYPPAIARSLAERVMALGGALLRRSVASLAAHRVALDDGSIVTADAIVVAAGVSSPSLVAGLPIVPRKGHLVITDRHPGLVHHQLVELGYLHSAHTFSGASVAFNVQPRRTGQLLIGSSRELVGYDATFNHDLVGQMLDRATHFVPAIAQVRAVRSWIGFRPATPDKLPLIGRWPAEEGLWIAAGHEGLGITMATGTADLIVAGLLERTPPVDPERFRPDRVMPAMERVA
jgi:glycine/D-amino acid oxidase-like deaminating enzyme